MEDSSSQTKADTATTVTVEETQLSVSATSLVETQQRKTLEKTLYFSVIKENLIVDFSPLATEL